jgi:AraC-like DNA-binding protein
MVELLRLYSNRQKLPKRLRDVRSEAFAKHRAHPASSIRQSQRRLDSAAIARLVQRYVDGSAIKDLAAEFGVHRTTITTLLRRAHIEPRQVGLKEGQVQEACALYRDGWSAARLGEQSGVDGTTVWRYLTRAGSVMRSPNERQY